jgi:hypothetical protein
MKRKAYVIPIPLGPEEQDGTFPFPYNVETTYSKINAPATLTITVPIHMIFLVELDDDLFRGRKGIDAAD